MNATPREYWPGVILHYLSEDLLVASCGYQIVARHPEALEWELVTRIPTKLILSPLSWIEPLRRLSRRGIRSYLQIGSESFLVFCEKTIFYWHQKLPSPIATGRIRRGNGPLLQGSCRDRFGTCYYGEYSGTRERREVYVWCWRPDWENWRIFYRFPAEAIRHIHAVQFDPFWEKVWIATGDWDRESMIGYFDGPANHPELSVVTSGGQASRAVSLMFSPGFVYWGSDAGKDTQESMNYIYRWSRREGKVERVAAVGGPVYYSTVDSRGRLYVSTAVEGSPSEKDSYAHIWMSGNGTDWVELFRLRKDYYPRIAGIPLFGNGVLSFPHGKVPDGKLYVVGHGVQGSPGTWVLDV